MEKRTAPKASRTRIFFEWALEMADIRRMDKEIKLKRKRVDDLEKAHPFLGNIKGLLRKQERKDGPSLPKKSKPQKVFSEAEKKKYRELASKKNNLTVKVIAAKKPLPREIIEGVQAGRAIGKPVAQEVYDRIIAAWPDLKETVEQAVNMNYPSPVRMDTAPSPKFQGFRE